MKTKLVDFQQHLFHDIEDEEKAQEYLDELLPIIGLVIVYFNGLESELDSVLCECFTDRTDSMGLIVLNKMTYSTKVDLSKRFSDDFQLVFATSIDGYELLISDLRQSGRLRNMVAHADWESTDEEGYAFVKLKISKSGMQQEYIQFSRESLSKLLDLISSTRKNLNEFWERRNDILYERV
ncbi:hypothetical protein [Neptuniibacter sp.]|uniref:hypothetical protein n=1 Tax=Neptuniibacter sp. TaxID=1962643 RepID=UPI003B5973EC